MSLSSVTALLDTLNKIPALADQNTRTLLLQTIPGASSIKRHNDAKSDLQEIVNFLISLGKFGTGEWVLARVSDL